MEPFVRSVVQLLCRTVKLAWFVEDATSCTPYESTYCYQCPE
jgi:hypothetical protein